MIVYGGNELNCIGEYACEYMETYNISIVRGMTYTSCYEGYFYNVKEIWGLGGDSLEYGYFYSRGDINNPENMTAYLSGQDVAGDAEFYCRGYDTCTFYWYGNEFPDASFYGCDNSTSNATCIFKANDYSWINPETKEPTGAPTYQPTSNPTKTPSSEPTNRPTSAPTSDVSFTIVLEGRFEFGNDATDDEIINTADEIITQAVITVLNDAGATYVYKEKIKKRKPFYFVETFAFCNMRDVS